MQAILTIQTSILAHRIHDGHHAPEGSSNPVLVAAPSSTAGKHPRDTQGTTYAPDLPQQGPERPRPGARLGWKMIFPGTFSGMNREEELKTWFWLLCG